MRPRRYGEIGEDEYQRLANNGARVFVHLSDGEWHDSTEFCVPGIGGSAGTVRARMLRKLGIHVMVRKHPEGGAVRQYRMDLTTVGEELARGICDGSIKGPTKKVQPDLPVSTIANDSEILDWLNDATPAQWDEMIQRRAFGDFRAAVRSTMAGVALESLDEPKPDPEPANPLGESLTPLAPRVKGGRTAGRRRRG